MSKAKLYTVIFQPDGISVAVPAGTLISKAASAAGLTVETPCGGIGICGKCKVRVSGLVTEPDATEIRLLGSESIKDGFRLSCMTKVAGNCIIEIPEESRSIVQKILSEAKLRDFCVRSGVVKTYLKLNPPSLEDEKAEYERISETLHNHGIHITPNLKTVKHISTILKESDYKVTVSLADEELIDIECGSHTDEIYGIAYDLGSTTIVGYLMNLSTGKDMGVAAVMNPQMVYGDDLISRISFSTTHQDGIGILQQSAVDALNRIALELTKKAKIQAKHIYKVTVVGNTCMTHILLGIDIASLGQSPYVPSICSDIIIRANDLGLNISPQAKIWVLPNVAGFVGSDLVGVLLANLWKDDGRTRLAVDIGTNGEMAFRHNGETYVCSAAAGPAFEGAGISCGMRGGPGAIDSIIIDDDVHYSTIHNKKPIGICGSGLVDAVAQMLEAGIIDFTGRMITLDETANLPENLRNRFIQTKKGVEFLLAAKNETSNGKQITLTAGDIRHLQLAKGSIHAAIQTLVKSAGASDEDIEQILLAGAFGNYIRVESAIRIGLIPQIDRNKVISIGNAAGSGSKLALICETEMQRARDLAKEAKHMELAVSPYYQMELMERMMFPEQ